MIIRHDDTIRFSVEGGAPEGASLTAYLSRRSLSYLSY